MDGTTIEFQTVIKDNMIRLPQEYWGKITSPVVITIQEKPDMGAALDRIWAQTAGRKSLSDEEIETEIKAARQRIRERKHAV
jgi:hypothetical protein